MMSSTPPSQILPTILIKAFSKYSKTKPNTHLFQILNSMGQLDFSEEENNLAPFSNK